MPLVRNQLLVEPLKQAVVVPSCHAVELARDSRP
ncbi:hypothetical protein BJ986_000263 [Phycicoccus badiiscoriae]|uniref:Uncharacterized protein n=1 Tax=Pedococcus badiiscoriae TaxID=642776 RepID=A0A852WJT0_9MICO|nr:hypothetical protein [Pedococcus badiiscoriae]